MLLEKVVLIVVSLFCVGTEIRFLRQKAKDLKYELLDSDVYHARALLTASLYLPDDCPLLEHITSSYCKNHLNAKMQRM